MTLKLPLLSMLPILIYIPDDKLRTSLLWPALRLILRRDYPEALANSVSDKEIKLLG